MATLWGKITSRSSIAVQAGNSFWDHLTSQPIAKTSISPTPIVYGETLILVEEAVTVVLDDSITVTVE